MHGMRGEREGREEEPPPPCLPPARHSSSTGSGLLTLERHCLVICLSHRQGRAQGRQGQEGEGVVGKQCSGKQRREGERGVENTHATGHRTQSPGSTVPSPPQVCAGTSSPDLPGKVPCKGNGKQANHMGILCGGKGKGSSGRRKKQVVGGGRDVFHRE